MNVDLPSEISNTGRIVVNKCIDKIDKRESILQAKKDFLNKNSLDKNEKMLERKKKGRLYSLGGNEPPKKGQRGRLDRLKTVGTFDLGTEMTVLSEVARSLNQQLISGELGIFNSIILPEEIRSHSTTPPISSSMQTTNARNTPNSQKRVCKRAPIISSILKDGRLNEGFKAQHSADDCVQRCITVPEAAKKSRSLSSSSYLNKLKTSDINPPATETILIEPEDKKVLNNISDVKVDKNFTIEKDSKKIEDDICSTEHISKKFNSKDFSYRNRKTMLRKSRRIVRTDSEIFKEGIVGNKSEYFLRNNSDIQFHLKSEENSVGQTELIGENYRNCSVTSSSVCSRKDSSDLDDTHSPKEPHKSTDESSKNISTDEMDAVFSDSTTDLERIEKEYKELIKTNLQREYKSDSDTLDEIGKKRIEFSKWKNQSLEHEFEFSHQELVNIMGEQTLSSRSYGTSTETKEMSRICSPESCTNGVYSDSGVKAIDENYSTYSAMRSRVYSSSRVGETPKEKERLYPLCINHHKNFIPIVPNCANLDNQSPIANKNIQIRPSNLEINVCQPIKPFKEGTISSIFEKPFGKFKKVNKLLKCKRFSTSTLYEKKKSEDLKKSPNIINRFADKDNRKLKSNTIGPKNSIHLSKLSLFSHKPVMSSIFSRKSAMFSTASHSNNELSSKTSSRTKLSEVSRSNTELSKYRASPLKNSTRKSSKYGKNSSTTCLETHICHSPLSEEFYNKTGSVRLSAMELYEKFCCEDFGGLYKHENIKSNERREGSSSQHEFRLEKKGLRAIGRYNKNARLLKQKSEPKFNLRASVAIDSSYYQEEEEYRYNDKVRNLFEYYNEQDEFYEYGDVDIEGLDPDCYEDEEGDYYEDDGEVDEFEEENNDSLHFADNLIEYQDNIDFQLESGATCLELALKTPQANVESTTGTDSDVDEIFLMPTESKCCELDEYGFENKHFSMKHSMLIRTSAKNGDLIDVENIKGDISHEDLSLPQPENWRLNTKDDEILTIYRICSKEELSKINEESLKQRSTSFHGRSLGKVSNENIKLPTADMYIEEANKIESADLDKADSLEFLSNSSATIRSRSTLTEYAFDTVRNLNLDSCSTSKLSLSLKSEVFDDFTITPDDLKTIQNCEFEDFTLTPEGSLCDGNEIGHQQKNYIDNKSSLDDGCPNKVLAIVDIFLTKERNCSHFVKQMPGRSLNSSSGLLTASNNFVEQESLDPLHSKSTIVQDKSERQEDEIVVGPYENESECLSAFTSELTKEFDRLFSKAQLHGEHIYEINNSDTEVDISEKEKISSRYSMQKLEPYCIEEKGDNCLQSDVKKADLKVKKSEPVRHSESKFPPKKTRSQSLGNINKKTKCFPL